MPISGGSSVEVGSVPPTAAEHGADTDHSQDFQSHFSLWMPGSASIKCNSKLLLPWLHLIPYPPFTVHPFLLTTSWASFASLCCSLFMWWAPFDKLEDSQANFLCKVFMLLKRVKGEYMTEVEKTLSAKTSWQEFLIKVSKFDAWFFQTSCI